MQTKAYIAIGSNLGDRAQTIESGIDSVRGIDQTELLRVSTIIETDRARGARWAGRLSQWGAVRPNESEPTRVAPSHA